MEPGRAGATAIAPQQGSGFERGGTPRARASWRGSHRRLALIGLWTAIAVTSGEPGKDTGYRLAFAHRIWTGQPVMPPGLTEWEECFVPGRHGELHLTWGAGQVLVLLPFDILATKAVNALHLAPAPSARLRTALITCLTFGLIAAGILSSALWLLRLLGFSERESVVGALGLQFATTALTYTQYNQENSLSLLLLLFGMACHLDWLERNRRRSLLAGAAALGFALLVRLTCALDLATVGGMVLALSWGQKGIRDPQFRARVLRYAAVMVPVTLLFLALDRLYQWIRFGSVWTTYFGLAMDHTRRLHPELPAAYPATTPIASGIWRTLTEPHRSIFLFDPLLIVTIGVAILGWSRLWRRAKVALAALFLLLAGYLLVHAPLYDWATVGASWGFRYVLLPV
ncbi:MAG TPA: glycosyltransferase family 39 protein, partial [Anaeromyxobacteraceae bacterium]|nr:glycosyltransferase family 39 protein [Anaeromyxobacteraceae bacterium]